MDPANKGFVNMLDIDSFDAEDLRATYETIRAYLAEYRTVPDRVSAEEYLTRELDAKGGMSEEDKAHLVKAVRSVYRTDPGDVSSVRDAINDYAARRRGREALKKALLNLEGGGGGVGTVRSLIGELSTLLSSTTSASRDASTSTGKVLGNYFRTFEIPGEGHPTYLTGLNRLTASGGFKKPEFIIIAGGPKGYKTGTALNIALGYVKEGMNVYYVDTENGKSAIRDRFLQALAKCELKELNREDVRKALKYIVPRVRLFGGEIIIDHYAANRHTVADVEARLEYLRVEEGWEPDLIVWDYPDLMVPSVRAKGDKRHEDIATVYYDIVALNSRLGIFSLGITQVKADAVDKEVIQMQDFGGAFAKAMIAHAAFAICRTEDEVAAGIGRLVPVFQRQGVRYSASRAVFVEINEACMHLAEITVEEAAARLAPIMAAKPAKKGRKAEASVPRPLRVELEKLVDE